MRGKLQAEMSVSLLLPQSLEDGNHRIQCPGDVLQERNMGKHRQKIKHFKASYLIILGHAGSNAQKIVKHEKKTIGLKPCFRPFLPLNLSSRLGFLKLAMMLYRMMMFL